MKRDEIWRLVFILFLGQLVSLCVAVASFTSSLIANLGVDTPLTQSFFAYFSLALVYGSFFLISHRKLLVPWYWYILLAIVDVQGNFLVVKAYQYSSITSVNFLDCWIIPWVIILTWAVLRTRYSPWQFLGASVCLVGLALVLLSDTGDTSGGGKKPLLGDVLVIAGTFCYAFSSVGEEFCVKKKDRVEVVMMLGVFGALISAIEISIMEKKKLETVKWSSAMVSLFAGFAAATFLFHSITPFVLKMSGATLFNLSLLTADLWAVLIRIFFYHQQVNWLYYVAFGVLAVGLLIYSVNEPSSTSERILSDEERATQYESLDDEEISSKRDEASAAEQNKGLRGEKKNSRIEDHLIL